MKRGSALLVVLGMLSFMVISAVAFSAFMRYSRLPSSYLRRTSSSRHLVKAALAEAIDIIDASIADNPHPGVGSKSICYPRDEGYSINRNYWKNNVFLGTNILVAAEETISTLTFEGLAYLPPALINEARFYSRHSTAARWHTFGYDCGRYAFCAVDVSDHLNVNKVPADIARGSLPENRFSLAYAFEDESHTSYAIQPSSWDTFMEKYVSFANVKGSIKTPAQRSGSGSESSAAVSPSLPFVSLADLNLAVNKNGSDFRQCFPFVDYLEGGASELVTSPNGNTAEMQRHMALVTDGYYPSSAGASDNDDYDLADYKYQPFTESNLKSPNLRKIGDFYDGTLKSLGADRLQGEISCFGLAMLWDYLDENDIPVSLAMPSVERIPMICGIRVDGNKTSVQFESKLETPNGNALSDLDAITANDYEGADTKAPPADASSTRKVRYVRKYFLSSKLADSIEDVAIKAVVAYPFLRFDSDDFTIDGHVEFFLTTPDMKLRTNNSGDALHMEDDSAFEFAQYRGGVFHLPLQSQGVSFSSVSKETDAVKEFSWQVGASSGSSSTRNAMRNNCLLKVTYAQTQTAKEIGENKYRWENGGGLDKIDASSEIPPLAANGAPDQTFTDPGKLKGYLEGDGEFNAVLRMAVWLRIKNASGKTVDLVPACVHDDLRINSVDNVDSPCVDKCGRAYPVMRFDCGMPFVFKDAAFDSNGGSDYGDEFKPKGVLCGDPRWNWAPEHWFEDANVTQQEWLDKCRKGEDGRDRDIFMATSDAGYMQSVYELAFLPRLLDGFGNGADDYGNMKTPDDGRAIFATDFPDAMNSGFMWRTYSPFAHNGAVRDDFESVGFVSDGGATKLNPYSDNENILMAAFANTPVDWWSASANTENGVPAGERKAATFNKKYAFSEMNSQAKFDWKDLKRIAATFRSQMRAQETVNGWIGGYNNLWAMDGETSDKSLMGTKLEGNTGDLYDVDRKFLYGYWRDCFAVKQQLFLIFVRAEPMMMGGGAIAQTPPQLGARAVALVWRNPHRGSKAYTDTGSDGEDSSAAPANAPHQTRVLMYRQFD